MHEPAHFLVHRRFDKSNSTEPIFWLNNWHSEKISRVRQMLEDDGPLSSVLVSHTLPHTLPLWCRQSQIPPRPTTTSPGSVRTSPRREHSLTLWSIISPTTLRTNMANTGEYYRVTLYDGSGNAQFGLILARYPHSPHPQLQEAST